MRGNFVLSAPLYAAATLAQSCPDYSLYSQQRHPPYSSGRYQLSYQRPDPACRTFNSSDVEDLIARMESVIADPDLYRLFQNSYPNTLDTAIRWKGAAADDPAEELTFVITGDINAMWLRDSANQMQSYLPVLKADPSPDGIASLYRGVINLQARYLLTSPYCNSFQAPEESGIPPATNGAAAADSVTPPYSPEQVFECKYELDSLAAFLEVSANYYNGTGDVDFFGKFQWVAAVQSVMGVAKAMQTPTYGADGSVLESPYLFTRDTTRSTETFANDGLGNPVANGTGLIRSGFRPSDDSTIFQLFIPANMMFARYLESTAEIMAKLGDRAPSGLADEMSALAKSLRQSIETYGVVPLARTPGSGAQDSSPETIYAYEVDGFGSAVIMDDANIPSLLAAPFFGYLDRRDPVYQRTRRRILDADTVNGNPYFMRGPVISSVGGPHAGPGAAWPMASIVRVLTSDDDGEITEALGEIVSSTDGYGLIHESVSSFDAGRWTRQW
jgi:meiotically up-regulated gene 157 (Mug157) protein